MRLWTIQPPAVYDQVLEDGVALVETARMRHGGYVPDQYWWLVGQLERRLGWTPGRLPWWTYTAKPDLRAHRWAPMARGEEVRLEMEVRADRAFVFPIWAWDRVYSQDYLALSKAEEDDWTERMLASVPLDPEVPDWRLPLWPLPEPWMGELAASWERLFNPALPAEPWQEDRLAGKDAVIEEIRREDIRAATRFRRVQRTSMKARRSP